MTTLHLQRDTAYEQLLNLILSGAIPHDQSLSERKLAETLALGRTPVREAIRALARDGILETHSARGTFVKNITIEQIHELFEVRQALEPYAAFLAAKRGPTPALSSYRKFFEKTKRTRVSDNLAATYETGVEFHVEIVRAARNAVLLELYLPLRLRYRLAMRLAVYYDKMWVLDGMSDHLAILDAIEAHDGNAAQRLMHEHLSRSYDSKRKILSGLRDTSRLAAGALVDHGTGQTTRSTRRA